MHTEILSYRCTNRLCILQTPVRVYLLQSYLTLMPRQCVFAVNCTFDWALFKSMVQFDNKVKDHFPIQSQTVVYIFWISVMEEIKQKCGCFHYYLLWLSDNVVCFMGHVHLIKYPSILDSIISVNLSLCSLVTGPLMDLMGGGNQGEVPWVAVSYQSTMCCTSNTVDLADDVSHYIWSYFQFPGDWGCLRQQHQPPAHRCSASPPHPGLRSCRQTKKVRKFF